MTFTAEVLIQDPFGAAALISKIHAHPFWRCFILPSVMGMATSFLCGEADVAGEIQM